MITTVPKIREQIGEVKKKERKTILINVEPNLNSKESEIKFNLSRIAKFLFRLFILICVLKGVNSGLIETDLRYCRTDDSVPELDMNFNCENFEKVNNNNLQTYSLLEKKEHAFETNSYVCKVIEIHTTTFKDFWGSKFIEQITKHQKIIDRTECLAMHESKMFRDNKL